MPTAMLKFNLPDEQSEFYYSTKGFDSFYCLWDLDQFLRNEIKYKDKPADALEIRDKLYEIMEERRVSFEEVR